MRAGTRAGDGKCHGPDDMAMSIAGQFAPDRLSRTHWVRFAADLRLQEDELLTCLVHLASDLPAQAGQLRDETRDTIAWSPLLDLIVDDIATRCEAIRQVI